jgi:hypothetical protein
VSTGILQTPFVLIDVGVQGGEHPRWHRLGDYLVVHGFDPIVQCIERLRRQNAGDRIPLRSGAPMENENSISMQQIRFQVRCTEQARTGSVF